MKMSFKIVAVFAVFLVACCAFAQQKYPKGLYMSYEEILSRSPSVLDSINVVVRTHSEISMVGGNDYKLESEIVANKILKRKAYAYSDGDTLFINCKHYNAQPWYAKVYSTGDYLLFDAGISDISNKADRVGTVLSSAFLGGVGGAFFAAKVAHYRYHYYVRLDALKKLNIITIDFLDSVIMSKADVSDEYMKERKEIDAISDKKLKNERLKDLADKYIPYINIK